MNDFAEFQETCLLDLPATLGEQFVVIAGLRYAADVNLEPAQPMHEFGGDRIMQWLHVVIPKASLVAEPATETPVTYSNRVFTVRRVSGHEENERAWTIDAMRTSAPGEI